MLPIELLLSPIAFLVGIIAAMVGVGGGIFIVPILLLIFDFPTHQAVGTSITAIIFTSLSSNLSYWRQRRVDYKVGMLFVVTTIPGSFFGAYLTTLIETRTLGLIFGFFLLLVALRMTFRSNLHQFKSSGSGRGWHRKIVDSDGKVFEYSVNVGLGLLLSFFGGISSGLLGLGGGSIMVSIMHILMNFPMHISVATSFFIMVFTSMSGAATHLFLGNVHFEYAILLGVGIIFGAQLGAYLSKRMSGRNLGRIFGAVLFLVSIRMIWKYI